MSDFFSVRNGHGLTRGTRRPELKPVQAMSNRLQSTLRQNIEPEAVIDGLMDAAANAFSAGKPKERWFKLEQSDKLRLLDADIPDTSVMASTTLTAGSFPLRDLLPEADARQLIERVAVGLPCYVRFILAWRIIEDGFVPADWNRVPVDKDHLKAVLTKKEPLDDSKIAPELHPVIEGMKEYSLPIDWFWRVFGIVRNLKKLVDTELAGGGGIDTDALSVLKFEVGPKGRKTTTSLKREFGDFAAELLDMLADIRRNAAVDGDGEDGGGEADGEEDGTGTDEENPALVPLGPIPASRESLKWSERAGTFVAVLLLAGLLYYLVFLGDRKPINPVDHWISVPEKSSVPTSAEQDEHPDYSAEPVEQDNRK